MDSLDRLLGPRVVVAGEDGSLRLNEAALAASLHIRPRSGRRCHCLACLSDREAERAGALEPYLRLLLEESPLDAEEIKRVRAELHRRRPAPPVAQPWQPRAPRTAALAGESAAERPAA